MWVRPSGRLHTPWHSSRRGWRGSREVSSAASAATLLLLLLLPAGGRARAKGGGGGPTEGTSFTATGQPRYVPATTTAPPEDGEPRPSTCVPTHERDN
jgi:hypothetical protein